MTRCVLILALAAFGLVGCREPDGEPSYNRNLGTASNPLLPGPGVVVDTSLRENASGQAIDLPELPEEIPSVDEMYSEREESDVEDGDEGDGMEDDLDPDNDANETESDDDEQETEPDEFGVGD
jgi:hypothetical protein